MYELMKDEDVAVRFAEDLPGYDAGDAVVPEGEGHGGPNPGGNIEGVGGGLYEVIRLLSGSGLEDIERLVLDNGYRIDLLQSGVKRTEPGAEVEDLSTFFD